MKTASPPPVCTGLQGRHILLGVSGSIAAYKAVDWARQLIKEEALVSVVLTKAGERFVTALTFAAISGRRVYQNMFDTDPEGVMAHIALPREADIVLVAPATAQTIARLAHGQADDLLAACALAANKPVVVCPAMNSRMLAHPATQANLRQLQGYGYHIIASASGSLACGEEGQGRLPEWVDVREQLLALCIEQDLAGKTVLITAGPTREGIDPARYLSNRSSGKMGYALARTARRRGAKVILVSGPVHLPVPPGIALIPVQTAAEMYDQVLAQAEGADIIVKAAAVADFRPVSYASQKIKKHGPAPSLELTRTADILQALGANRRPDQFLVGFAAESHGHEGEGQRKLLEKGADLMVVNDILGARTGFDVDTNQVWLLDGQGSVQLPLCSKEQTANAIWDRVVRAMALRSIQEC
jgi:phosphopantothenoylcysteine decarboxylase / phosphopantothenate---cysteine ligase